MKDSSVASTQNHTLLEQLFLSSVAQENTLFILPPNFDYRGLICYFAEYFFDKFPSQKIVLLLSDVSYYNFFKTIESYSWRQDPSFGFPKSDIPISERSLLYQSKFLITTGALFYNDLLRQFISPSDISLVIYESAHLAKNGHVFCKIADIFYSTDTFPRIIGFSSYNFSSYDSLKKTLEALFISKIEFRSSADSLILQESPHSNVSIIVPVNQQINDLCVFIRNHIYEIVAFFEKQGIDQPLFIRKSFSAFTESIASSPYASDLIHQALILSHLQNLHDTLESEGPSVTYALLSTIEENENRSDSKKSNLAPHNFSSSTLFDDINTELKTLIEQKIGHPKKYRLLQFLRENQVLEKNHSLIINCRSKTCVTALESFLQKNNIPCRGITNLRLKSQREAVDSFSKGFLRVLITTKNLSLSSDLRLFYSIPVHFRTFLERYVTSQRLFFLITHHSHEERVYHKFLNREKQTEEIIHDSIIKLTLIRIQKKNFDRRLDKQIDPRTKTMLSIVKQFNKNRTSSSSLPSSKSVINAQLKEKRDNE